MTSNNTNGIQGTNVLALPINWESELRLSGRGKIRIMSCNFTLILENDPYFKGKIHMDSLSGDVLLYGSNGTPAFTNGKAFHAAGEYIERNYEVSGHKTLDDAMVCIAEDNPINPIAKYLRSLSWDGTKRIAKVFEYYFGVEENPLNEHMATVWMVSAVQRGIKPGTKNDYCLVLTGDQGIGKSTFVQMLGVDWASDTLDSFKGKEAYQQIRGAWIVELPELEGFTPKAVKTIKQFLAKSSDTYRAPYSKDVKKFPRGQVFIGTTNDEQFLDDKTGTRRFLCLLCQKAKIQKDAFLITRDEVDQLWAEAFALYKDGYDTRFSRKEETAIEANNTRYCRTDPRVEQISQYLDIPLPKGWADYKISKRRTFIQDCMDGAPKKNTGGDVRKTVSSIEVFRELLAENSRVFGPEEKAKIRELMKQVPGWSYVNRESAVCATKRFGPYGTKSYYIRDGGVTGKE